MILLRFDRWLIACAFQPLSEWLTDRTGKICYWWAKEAGPLFVGAAMVFYLFTPETQWTNFLGAALAGGLLGGTGFRYLKLYERHPDRTYLIAPHWVIARFAIIGGSIGNTLTWALTSYWWHAAGICAVDSVFFFGAYLLACTPRPPRRRPAKAPIFGRMAMSTS